MRVLFMFSLILVLTAVPAIACLWDYDTVAMERMQFPSALELITGKFLRHSKPFYEWRIKDRKRRIAEDPSDPKLYDDLAVAYEKAGNSTKAIEIMREKNRLHPDLYETHANLGTFYVHSGQFKKGIEHIDKALAINPDAHFGRELYQRLLVEYISSKSNGGALQLPLDETERFAEDPVGFGKFVLEQRGLKPYTKEGYREIGKAITGVLGMMRFGNHDSPVLLEALGDLMCSMEFNETPRQLAARAFLKASYETAEEVRQAYRKQAEDVLRMQRRDARADSELPVRDVETQLKNELADANNWYAEVAADEENWIESGLNLDEEFTKKYYRAPSVAKPQGTTAQKQLGNSLRLIGIIVLSIVFVSFAVSVLVIFFYWHKPGRKSSDREEFPARRTSL